MEKYNIINWIYENYDKITGLDLDDRDDEMDFPEVILEICKNNDISESMLEENWG